MAKVLKESAITTANARNGLAIGEHWRGIDPGVHLGYRRGKRGGVWLVRWREGAGYKRARLGIADDVVKVGTLSFDDAVRKARAYVEAARSEAILAAAGPVPTVRSAVEKYVAMRDARDSQRQGRDIRSDAGQRLGRYVLGTASRGAAPPAAALSHVQLHRLREADLREWLAGPPAELKATARARLANDLKAALNLELDQHRELMPMTVAAAVARGLRVDVAPDEAYAVARDNQILGDRDVTLLLEKAQEVDTELGWEGDLYRLLVVMAATGMRFSQVVRMRVRDVQRENLRLIVPPSRKGKGVKYEPVKVPVARDVIETLTPAIAGRSPAAILLERWRYGQAPGGIQWIKDRRGPWGTTSEISRSWRVIKTRATMPHIDPYAFRHSSIVRALRANLNVKHVAGLHDTSVVMIERHYARYIVDGLDEVAAKAVVSLVPRFDQKVLRFSRGADRTEM